MRLFLNHTVFNLISKKQVYGYQGQIFENFDFGEVTLRNSVLEKVSTFKYLGHVITDDCNDVLMTVMMIVI